MLGDLTKVPRVIIQPRPNTVVKHKDGRPPRGPGALALCMQKQCTVGGLHEVSWSMGMPPDKMPPTVEFVFIFFKCCFSLLLHALNVAVAANCVKRIKIDLNIIIISYFIRNTKHKHAIYGNTHNSQTV